MPKSVDRSHGRTGSWPDRVYALGYASTARRAPVSSTVDLRVGVVGGSLGGLTAGLLPRDLDAEVDVYERSRTLFEGLGTADPFVQAVFDIEVPRMASAAWA